MNFHINTNNIDYNDILRYLGYKNIQPDADTIKTIYECKKEISKIATYKYLYSSFEIDRFNSMSATGISTLKLVNTDVFFEGLSIKNI